MSYEQSIFIIAASPDQMEYRPTAAVLVELVNALERDGWLRCTAEYDGDGPTEVFGWDEYARRLIARPRGLDAIALGFPGPRRSAKPRIEEVGLEPRAVGGMSFLVMPRLAGVPSGMEGHALACPECGEDMQPAFQESFEQATADDETFRRITLAYPEPRCPACQKAIDLRALSSGEDAEPSPFFRFAVVIALAPVEDFTDVVPPSLMETVRTITGIEMRSIYRMI